MSEPNTPSYPPPPPPTYTPPPAGGTSSNRTLMLVLSYILFLGVIPLVSEKNDPEVQWHAKHGLVLFGAEVVVWIVASIFSMFLHCFGCFVHLALWLVILILHIVCIVKAVNGQRLIIPGLSDFADKF
jgi:uncharacterized membrane protein